MRCDFCGRQPLEESTWWEHDCPDFTVTYLMEKSDGSYVNDEASYQGHWKACRVCNDLVMRARLSSSPDKISGAQHLLADRGLEGMLKEFNKNTGIEVTERLRSLCEAMVHETHAAFLQHSTGKVVVHAPEHPAQGPST